MMLQYCQRFIDDIGVLVAMVSITLIAVIVVIIKVILVHTEVTIPNRNPVSLVI